MTRIILAAFFVILFFPVNFAAAQNAGPAPKAVSVPYPCSFTPDTCPPPIGTITEIEGGVIIYAHDEQPANAKVGFVPKVGQLVYLGDLIETSSEAKVLVLFIDDTELTLGENARMTVDEYVFDAEDTGANKGRFSVLEGPFVFATGLLSKKENPDVRIETAYGSLGIRGTVVWGGAVDQEYNIFVQEGLVTVATDRGRVNVGPGEGTMLQSRRAIPTRVKAWGPEKIDKAIRTVKLRNAEQVKQRVTKFKERHGEMREKHKQKMREKRGQIQEQKQEKRGEIQEQRQQKKAELKERREEKQAAQQADEPAREIERREKIHLNTPRHVAPPPRAVNPPAPPRGMGPG